MLFFIDDHAVSSKVIVILCQNGFHQVVEDVLIKVFDIKREEALQLA